MLIQLKEITKVYRTREIETTALDNVNIGIEKGEFVSVMGPSGCGKSTRHMPAQLSGGQCQRVAIARAIVGSPEIILADEPTGNLDSRMGAEVMDILHRLNREDGKTIVMVTHNEEQARQTDRIIRFFDGRQVQ